MIDQDQQRDYAEEAAARSDQEQERAEEAAFETSQAMLVADLRLVAEASRRKALDLCRAISVTIGERALVEPPRVAFMERAAATAHLADRAALTVGRYRGYQLMQQVEELLRAHGAAHPTAAAAHAAAKVRDAARRSLDASEERRFADASGHQG